MSDAIDDGGPAFPIPEQQFSDGVTIVSSQGAPGMSLRDWFAGQAISGLAPLFYDSAPDADNPDGDDPEQIARTAYLLADAMLAARKVQP